LRIVEGYVFYPSTETRHPLATHLPALRFCPFPLFAVAKGEEKGGSGGKGGEEQRSAAAPGRRRRAKAGDRNRRHEERRGGRLRWGWSRTGNRNVHAAENTFAMPPPTPSRPRLHHCPNVSTTTAILLLPPSLVSFQCWTGDVEARLRYPYPVCVLALEPQPCRPATGRSSWTRHVPGHAVAVRRASEIAGLRVELVLLQGMLSAAVPPRVTPLVTRRLRRAGRRGRACLRHGCGQRTPRRASCLAIGWPRREGGRRDALEHLGNFLSLARRRRACSRVGSRASSRADSCREKTLASCCDALAAVGSNSASRLTRRAPSARTRALTPV
jgi:hypothetical protein